MVMVANRQSHYATSDMPGMKADSKRFRSVDFFAILPRQQAGGPFMKTIWLCTALLAPGLFITSAAAEILVARVPLTLDAIGGICDRAPDDIAPGADGKDVEHSDTYFDYAVRGDALDAQAQMGIGVRVRIKGFGPGDLARVQIVPPSGQLQFWDYDIGDGGMIEFAYLPRVGGTLSRGRYLFSVMDGDKAIFTAAITLNGLAEESLCVPVS